MESWELGVVLDNEQKAMLDTAQKIRNGGHASGRHRTRQADAGKCR